MKPVIVVITCGSYSNSTKGTLDFIGVLENKHLENWKTKREIRTKGMFE